MAGTPALKPETIGDVEQQDDLATPQEQDEMGFTPEERAEWDAMVEADKRPPGEPEEAEDAGEPTETSPRPGDTPLEAVPPPGAKKQPPAPPEEDDEPDQITRDPRTGREQRSISYNKHQRLLNKERAALEALRTQAEQGRIDHAKLTERLAILNDALTAPPPPRELSPQEQEYQRQQEVMQNPMLENTIDPNVDFAGAIEQLQRRQYFMAQASMAQQQETNQTLADQAMVRDFTRDAENYSRTEAGQHFFGENGAYQFLKNRRLIEISLNLFEKDPSDPNEQFTQKEINQLIADFNDEEKGLVADALGRGRSPSKMIMMHAKARGWRPPQAAPVAAARSPAPARRTAAAAPPAARLPHATPSAVAQLQAEMDGARASRSLSDGGGVPPAEPLSAEMLLRMDDDEFGAYIDNLPKNRLEAIMGREFPGRGG